MIHDYNLELNLNLANTMLFDILPDELSILVPEMMSVIASRMNA